MSPITASGRPEEFKPDELRRTSVLVVSITLLILFAPMIHRFTVNVIDDNYGHRVNSSPLALIITFLFGATILLISKKYLKSLENHDEYKWKLQVSNCHQRTTFFARLFSGLATNSRSGNNLTKDKASSSSYSLNTSHNQDNSDSNSWYSIDSKYLKPKFIFNELFTFWETTCTVITWGSFYCIGGTIVATEKLTRKIKSRTRAPGQGYTTMNNGSTDHRHSSRGTGQRDFSFLSGHDTASPDDISDITSQQKSRYRRISSWTKKSINSIKKQCTRTTRSGAPQIMCSPSSDASSSESFFFSNS